MERSNRPAHHYHYCQYHNLGSGPCACFHPEVEDWSCEECYDEIAGSGSEDENQSDL